MSPACSATWARMKENSPICVRPTPTFAAVCQEYAKARTTPVQMRNFPTMINPTSRASTRQLASQVPGSMSMPTVTKNRATNASRMGSVCCAILCANSELPSRSPARKAPRASDKPIASVVAATARQIVSVSSSEISSLQVLATRVSNPGISFQPASTTGTSRSSALPIVRAIRGSEPGQDYSQNDYGKIFDECQRDHHAPGFTGEFPAVHEQPHHHHRAGHADDASNRNPLQERPAHEHPCAQPERDGEKNSQGRAGERHPFHAKKIRDGKFDAHGKHEQNDADLSHDFKRMDVVHAQARSEGTEDEAGKYVAENQGLAQTPSQEAAEERRGKHHGDVAKDQGVRDHQVNSVQVERNSSLASTVQDSRSGPVKMGEEG